MCSKSRRLADGDRAKPEEQFTHALQRIDGWVTTPKNLRRTLVSYQGGRNKPLEAGSDGTARINCKEKFYSISTVLMGKIRGE
jgi:hypothetical protein